MVFIGSWMVLEFGELLVLAGGLALNFNDVEANSFAQRAALADGNQITDLNVRECRRAMGGQILVSLLISTKGH